jgi:outer membrane protein OmpA-like peptidoglycan-associated protein
MSGHSKNVARRIAPALRRLLLAVSLVLACAGLRQRAAAQVALDSYRPALLKSDGFALSRPEVLEAKTFQLQLTLDYANDPLLLDLQRARTQISVVQHHLVAHVGAAVAAGSRLTLLFGLPVHALMQGNNPRSYAPAADGAGLGDLALGGRVLLVGNVRARGMLSAELMARLPTAELFDPQQSYRGDAIGSYEPALIGELTFGPIALRIRAGARFRKQRAVGDLKLGQELIYGAGARIRLIEQLYGHLELYGSAFTNDLGRAQNMPLELLAGLKWDIRDWNVGAAGGPGLVRGYGSPDARVLLSLTYAPVKRSPAPALDSDGDGLHDTRDACAARPEDRDGFEDSDGCPEDDNDRDGVLDAQDACPLQREDLDGDHDADGCAEEPPPPPPCPAPGQRLASPEDVGRCPDADQDGDGVRDREDACQLEPGAPDNRGCPRVRVDSESQQITISDRIEFASNGHEILGGSEGVLQQVADVLEQNPALERVRIEGHTDDVGRDARNLELSRRRAGSVARWLSDHGVAKERLQAWGCGEARPLVPNDDDEARQKNRRVEFHILSAGEALPADGCVQLPLR